MIQDITVEKDDIKSNGIHVDGRNYAINFTGKLPQCTPDRFDVLHVSAHLLHDSPPDHFSAHSTT